MDIMVCSHRIVATRTVLGLWENRGADRRPGKVASVLRLTIGPLVVYSLIDAAIAGVLAAVEAYAGAQDGDDWSKAAPEPHPRSPPCQSPRVPSDVGGAVERDQQRDGGGVGAIRRARHGCLATARAGCETPLR